MDTFDFKDETVRFRDPGVKELNVNTAEEQSSQGARICAFSLSQSRHGFDVRRWHMTKKSWPVLGRFFFLRVL